MSSWGYFLFLIVLNLCFQGFFAMMEMACVSINRVRLQYYINQGSKRAKWIGALIKHPATLFGSTLIGLNAALQLGSECARRFYLSLGISPDLAPLSQVVLVLIFAELAPMFVARRYAEHVSMLGIPVLYVFSKIMVPVIWLLDKFCLLLQKIFRIPLKPGFHITREELQKAIESREEKEIDMDGDGELETVASNIFSLKQKQAKDLMDPLEKGKLVPSTVSVKEVRSILTVEYFPFVPIYHASKNNIVAIAYPRDLLRADNEEMVKGFAKQPWFILENNSIFNILKQFRKNNETVAVVLNHSGLAIGLLTLEHIVEELFGSKDLWLQSSMEQSKDQVMVDKSFPGNVRISEINELLHIHLPIKEADTLEELMVEHLGHRPISGESVRIEGYQLTMEEVGVLKGKRISVRTLT